MHNKKKWNENRPTSHTFNLFPNGDVRCEIDDSQDTIDYQLITKTAVEVAGQKPEKYGSKFAFVIFFL